MSGADDRDGIAVVGMACRTPGARDLDGYWRLMVEGVDAISAGLPDRRGIDWSAVRGLPVQPRDDRWGGFLEAVDEFDAEFFGITGKAAVRMDPAQRLLLETVWEAVEDAGVRPSDLAGSRTGVYTAFAVASEYWEMLLAAGLADLYSAVGAGSRGCVAGQLSYLLDLRGPSLALDAACAGSLLGVHLAARAIRAGEIDAALVGGVNLQLGTAYHLSFARGRLMSPTGTCRFGEEDANGYVRSEGVAAVLLKPERAARADGDRIHAVIRGSGVSNDGRTGRSLVAANADGQLAALRAAYRDARVGPAEVDYIEAHGTGTPVGDREELSALAEAVGREREPGRPCLIGSVKTNIGHTEAVSGLLGLIKTALALRHGVIPASLHVNRPQRLLREGGLRPVPRNTTWPVGERPRRAGISSFGLSGTNVHVVIEDPPGDHPPTPIAQRPLLGFALPLSARSPEALRETARRYARLLAGGAEPADACYSAAVRRDHHPIRSVAVAADRDGLVGALWDVAAGPASPPGNRAGPVRVVYLMTAGVPLSDRIERTLMRTVRPYRLAVAECERRIRTAAGRAAPATGTAPAEPAVRWTQQVALAAVWRHWGLEPDLVVGADDGVYAAATVAGLPGSAVPGNDAPAEPVGAISQVGRPPADDDPMVAGWSPGTGRATGPVEAAAAVRDLIVPGDHTVLVVFGPAGRAAAELEKEIVAAQGTAEVIDLHAIADRADQWLLEALGRAYVAGCDPDWRRVLPAGRYIDVPTTPWQRRRYWFTDPVPA